MENRRTSLAMRGLGFAPIVVCALGLAGWAAPALAQAPRPERPYRGLFGGGVGDAQQSLVANASFGGGYDDNILLDLPGAGGIDPRNAQKGGLGSGSGSLSYSANSGGSTFGSSFGSQVRYYPGQADPYVTAHSANVGGNLKLGPRTSLSGSQSVAYQPYTFSSIFPTVFDPVLGQLDEPRIDQATSTAEYLAFNTSAGFGHSFSQRLAFNAGYNFQRSDTAFQGTGTFTQQGGNAGFLFTLTRGLGLRLGYGVQEGRFPGSTNTVRTHNADVGLNFNRALSFSRRTTLSFGSGTTALNNGGNTKYLLVGNARLNHEIGRTWNASAAYNRSVQFVDLLLLPVLYDSFDTGVTGLVNRRVQVQSGFRASIGTLGVGRQSSGDFDTLQASAGVAVALTRFMQLSTTYSFFRYRFDQGALLPPGVAPNIDRQSIRVNVDLWAPLVTRARR